MESTITHLHSSARIHRICGRKEPEESPVRHSRHSDPDIPSYLGRGVVDGVVTHLVSGIEPFHLSATELLPSFFTVSGTTNPTRGPSRFKNLPAFARFGPANGADGSLEGGGEIARGGRQTAAGGGCFPECLWLRRRPR